MATVRFEDQEFELDIEELTLNQALYIYRQAKMSVRDLMVGLQDLNPDAMAALYWLMLDQNGKRADIGKLNFKILAFAAALSDAFPSDEEDAEADPTN